MQSISKLDRLRKRHHRALDYLEKNESVNVCSVDLEEKIFIIQSFKESTDTEDATKTYTVTKNKSRECDEADSKCLLFCNLCGICSHKYHCSCIDSSIKNNMCKHIHAVALSQPIISPGSEDGNNNSNICEDLETNFQDDIDHSTTTTNANEDNADDHIIPLQCENTEAEKMKLFAEEIAELVKNSLSYASSMEQLNEIKKNFVLPIKPTLIAASEQQNSTWSKKIAPVRGKMKKQVRIFESEK